MTKKDLINKAVYIQFPYSYTEYKEYNIDKEINKLPLPGKGMMYDEWHKNSNHFTTEYHRLYLIPLLCKLLKLKYNENDFYIKKRNSGKFNISLLFPKKDYKYEVYGYTRGEHFDNLDFNDITNNNSSKNDITDYHRLYMYSHECSRLINKTLKNGRKLFISGDSQMIPDVSFLSCFFEEVWYFDNREKLDFSKEWKNQQFSDVLIEINHLPLNEYIKTNFLEKNSIDIFIGTYKEFKVPVTNESYKIIVGNHKIKNDSDLELIECKHDSELDDTFYSELYMLKHISDNYNLKDYVGYCHYRKYFSFMDDIPNMDELFKECDAVVAKPIIHKRSVKEQYGSCHNLEDLYIIGGILADKYPQYCKAWHSFLNKNIFFPYNMFIMKREDFKEYVSFIYDILNEYVKIVGTDINKRIENNKDKYLKEFYPNNTIEYQYRIGGYLGERLTNLFIITHFTRIKAYPVKITEGKYTNKSKECAK